MESLPNKTCHEKKHWQSTVNISSPYEKNGSKSSIHGGFNSNRMFPDNISASGFGVTKISEAIISPGELGIVLVILMMWAAAISLFFNRWGKIRLMEPYQPHFEREQPISSLQRSSIGLHHTDRRHSLMLPQCHDEAQHQKRIKSCQANFHSGSQLDNSVNSVRLSLTPENFRLGYSAAPERRASFVNMFQLEYISERHLLNNRRRSEMNEKMNSRNYLSPHLHDTEPVTQRRISFPFQKYLLNNNEVCGSPVQTFRSLEDCNRLKKKYNLEKRPNPNIAKENHSFSNSSNFTFLSTVDESKRSFNSNLCTKKKATKFNQVVIQVLNDYLTSDGNNSLQEQEPSSNFVFTPKLESDV